MTTWGARPDCVFDELRLLVDRLEVANVDDPACLDDAARLRQTSENNVAGYSFLGLRSLNDGHIYPAQYLNALGNVYVLYKQGRKQVERMTDQFGQQHEIHYFTKPGDLVKKLDKSPRPTYFDLDVDYFFKESRGKIQGAEVMVPDEEIRSLLDLQNGLPAHIISRPLRGMTIAKGCFRAMSIICETLFEGSLLGDKVDWRGPS